MGARSLNNSSLDKGCEEVHGAMRFYKGVFDLVRRSGEAARRSNPYDSTWRGREGEDYKVHPSPVAVAGEPLENVKMSKNFDEAGTHTAGK